MSYKNDGLYNGKVINMSYGRCPYCGHCLGPNGCPDCGKYGKGKVTPHE